MHFWHLHPVIVHFPIALLVTAAGLRLLNHFARQTWLTFTIRILLVLGVLGLGLAVASGFLAAKTAPHVPEAWEVQHDHKQLGLFSLATGILLLGGSAWKAMTEPTSAWSDYAELGLWLILTIFVLSTGWHGGQLVFVYGVGVVE